MKLDKTSFALAAGFTGAIVSFIMNILMRFILWGGMMQMRKEMLGAQAMPIPSYPMTGWAIISGPIIMFFVAAGIGWLFAFFYNMLSKKTNE